VVIRAPSRIRAARQSTIPGRHAFQKMGFENCRSGPRLGCRFPSASKGGPATIWASSEGLSAQKLCVNDRVAGFEPKANQVVEVAVGKPSTSR